MICDLRSTRTQVSPCGHASVVPAELAKFHRRADIEHSSYRSIEQARRISFAQFSGSDDDPSRRRRPAPQPAATGLGLAGEPCGTAIAAAAPPARPSAAKMIAPERMLRRGALIACPERWRRSAAPIRPKPRSIVIQVPGSGTAGVPGVSGVVGVNGVSAVQECCHRHRRRASTSTASPTGASTATAGAATAERPPPPPPMKTPPPGPGSIAAAMAGPDEMAAKLRRGDWCERALDNCGRSRVPQAHPTKLAEARAPTPAPQAREPPGALSAVPRSAHRGNDR